MISLAENGWLAALKQNQRKAMCTVSSAAPNSFALSLIVIVAASMQCLRLASFMNRPTLLVIEALVMMGPYLTNSGKFLDASALYGGTVRLAQSIGCKSSTLWYFIIL